MSPLFQAILYISLFALFVFILLFGESSVFRDGPIGSAHRVLTQKCPHWIHKAFETICGKKVVRRWDAFAVRCVESRNPVFQIFFLTLVTAGLGVFLYAAWGRVYAAGGFHILLVPLVVGSVYVSFLRACWSNPGVLTRVNVPKAVQIWPFDGIIFQEKECRTCHFVKPARSKHCALCKVCVAKSDHHCAWINNCVGHSNYRLFILFLTTTIAMCCYGAYLTYYVFVREMKIQQVDKLWVINRDTGARTPIKWEQMWMYMVHREILLAALGLFCVCAGVVVFAFTLYQLSLIMRGVTTNEVFKWDDLKYDIKQGEVHIPRSVLERNQGLVPQEVDPEPTEKQQRKRKNAQRRSKASDSGRQRDSEQDELVLVEDAKQIRNIYHLGSWRNLMEMLFPTPL